MPLGWLSPVLTTLTTSLGGLKVWLYVAAALAPFVTYGWGVVKTKYAVRAEERAACSARIADIEKKINEAAAKQIQEARRAAEEVTPTPAAPAELARLCSADPRCRERVRKQ